MSIRTRIMLAGVGIVMVVICCLSSSLYALIAGGLGKDRDTALGTRADEAVASLATAPRESFTPHSELAPIDARSSVDVFVVVLTADGTVVSATGTVDGALASDQFAAGG